MLRLGVVYCRRGFKKPGLAADTLISLIETNQRPQLENVLADYDSLLAEIQQQFSEVQAERDALLSSDSSICSVDQWTEEWHDSIYGTMVLAANGKSLQGTYGGNERTVEGQVIASNGRYFFIGEWGRRSSDRHGPFLFELLSPSDFSGFWGEDRGAFTLKDIDQNTHTWSGSR